MVEEGRIINEEIFSYTRQGARFSNHEWMSQILFYLILHNFGPVGLISFKVVIVLAVSFFLFKTARFLNADALPSAFFVCIAVLAGLWRYTERPQLFSFLFLALCGFLFYGVREGKVEWRYLFVVPLVMVLWDFFHGALYGLIFLMFFVSGETLKFLLPEKMAIFTSRRHDPLWLRRVWIIFLLVLVVMLLNPYGLRSYDFFLKFTGDSHLAAFTSEFMPTLWGGQYLFWAILILGFALTVLFIKRADLTQFLVFTVFGVMALRFNRAIAPFALVALPLFSHYESLAVRSMSGLKKSAWKLIISFAIVGLVAYLVVLKFLLPGIPYAYGFGVNEKMIPVGAVRFVREAGLAGNMYNPGHMGGYIAYALYPGRRIFAYTHHITFGDLPQLTHSADFLDTYRINYAFVENALAMNLLFKKDQWVPVFWDSAAAVLVRNNSENSAIIGRYGLRYFVPWIQEEALQRIESSPSLLPYLTREIAQCLSFDTDENLAGYLGKLLMKPDNRVTPQEGISLAGEARRHNPRNVWLLAAQGSFYYKGGRLDEAERSFREALSIDRKLKGARVNLAYIAYDKGNVKDAEAGFMDLISRDRNDPEGYLGLGFTHRKMGRYDLARKDWEEFLRLTPSGPWADRVRENIAGMGALNR
jgi:tetratricopeptide (TPR) repeat protein